jgi:DNA-binding NarL/FixJ family response regulator
MPQGIQRICFADDDQDDHFIFKLAMTELNNGIEILSFDHCDDLIGYLNDERLPLPDLIFLDYNMPGNNGNQCLQAIKTTARLLHVPVVIHSTSKSTLTVEESTRFGAYKYILKATSIADTKQMIQELLSEFEKPS